MEMKKRVVHVGILAVIFVIAVIFFEYVTSKGNDNMMADLGNATLPRLYFSVDEYGVNPMNGYVQQMDMTAMRDVITPVTKNKLVLNVESEEREITALEYTVYTLDGEKRLYKDSVKKVGKQVTLNFEKDDLAEERLLCITLHTDKGEVYYYSRLVDPTGFNLIDCMNYIYNFHENALDKKENVGVGAALEPSADVDNSTFSHVTIQSDYDHVTWGDLEPKVTGGERWKIVESTASYTSVLLEYEVSCKGEENETDLYMVKEFFRVREASDGMHLLNYDRTMEQIFDGSKSVLSEKGIVLGIVPEDVDYAVNSEGNIVSFVQANELWNYDRDHDQMALLFSFRDVENMDLRNKISDHNIRILAMDKKGDTVFAVSGYMNRGAHEGRVGVSVYYYDIETNSVQEKAFVPSSRSAALAEEELGKLVYYSTKTDKLYMMAGGSLYEVNVDTDYEETLIEGLEDRQYAVSQNNQWAAWQTGETLEKSTQLNVMNLKNGEQYTVDAEADECILPLGFVGNDFVCGYAKQSEIGETVSGELAIPMYKVEIRHGADKVLKTYDAGEDCVLDASVKDGMITLKRGHKTGDVYTQISSDYISSNNEKDESNITLGAYVTELKQTQRRLEFLDGISDKNAKILKPKQALKDEPAILNFGDTESEHEYYVYGLGRLQGIYKNAGNAIRKADSVSGVVIGRKGQYVWERGNRYLTYSISGQEESLKKLQAELKSGKLALDAANSISNDQGLELTACKTEQVMYLINKDTYVIGVRGGAAPVILTGYTESTVTYVDVSNGQVSTVSVEQMDQEMGQSGSVYIGYLL